MKIAGIIAEYNPFHNGHAFQIEKTRSDAGADYIIAVMSPDFVQRGLPALADKHTRTRMALLGGADLVLELPVRFAVGSAEFFANGGVSLLDSLGCVDILSFGCETPDLPLMRQAALILNEEPEAFRLPLKAQLARGLSFPAARARALAAFLGKPAVNALLSSPNNILALEYLRALHSLNSAIQPFALQRRGEGYHSLRFDAGPLVSAAAIRALIEQAASASSLMEIPEPCGADSSAAPAPRTKAAGAAARKDAEEFKNKLSAVMPASSSQILLTALSSAALPSAERFDLLLHYALLEAAAADTLETFLDVGPNLASRIRRLLPRYESAEQFSLLMQTKDLTLARVRRALLHVLLRLTKTPAQTAAAGTASYARILGFRRSAQPLLHLLKETSRIPLIVKPAAARRQLSPAARSCFEQDVFASDLYRMLAPTGKAAPDVSGTGAKKENEYARSPIIL